MPGKYKSTDLQGQYAADDLVESTTQATNIPPDVAKDSMLTKAWNWVNKGLVTPDQVLKVLSMGDKATPQTVEELKAFAESGPKVDDKDTKAHIPGFGDIDVDKFRSGVRADESKTLSAFTNPASIATTGLSGLAKLPGAAGKSARALLTAMGMTYGGSGVKSVYEGTKKGLKTPEGSQEALLGASQIAGAAPAVAQTGRSTRAVAAKLFPALGQGERAFVASLRPNVREIPAIREAYKRVLPELQTAGIESFEDLQKFTETKRIETAVKTTQELARSGAGFTVDGRLVGSAVRSRITSLMKTRTSQTGRLPIEARFIKNEADNIERNLIANPKTIGEAEKLVQDLNATLGAFRKLPPQVRYEAGRRGDPEVVFTAVKEELQNQIESQMGGYKDLKARYGAYRELQNQAEKRIDTIDKQSGTPDMLQRRAVESIGGAIGALFSGQYLHGIADVLAGRASGDVYLEMASRPEKLLQRGLSKPKPPLPFGGQLTQSVAEGAKQ